MAGVGLEGRGDLPGRFGEVGGHGHLGVGGQGRAGGQQGQRGQTRQAQHLKTSGDHRRSPGQKANCERRETAWYFWPICAPAGVEKVAAEGDRRRMRTS